MPRIFRNKLVRGTKLCVEHITRVTSAIRSMLTTAGVQRVNIKKAQGRTRLTFQIPSFSNRYFANADLERNNIALTLPFPVPPLQEFFDTSGQTNDLTPTLIVDEAHVSFDQRREPAAIVDDGVNDGDLSYVEVKQYSLRIALVEKTPVYFGGTNAPRSPERTIFTMQVEPSSYSARTLRFNPFSLSGINRQLSPYRTYCLQLTMPRVDGAVDYVYLPSLTMTLVLRSPLVPRDSFNLTGTTPQNIPLPVQGEKNPDSIVPPVFVGNDPIEEDDVHLETYQLDQKLVQGLEGGYRRESVPPPVEHIEDDSCYEIIAVPMWANRPDIRSGSPDPDGPGSFPYVGAEPYINPTQDRRLIPIVHPWTLHHVVAVANYFAEDGFGVLPSSPTFEQQIAVGLVSGQRGDLMRYQRIAYTAWDRTAVSRSAVLVDEIKAMDNGLSLNTYDYEMVSVPLEGAGGTGYFSQGAPVFIGKGTDASMVRTDINGAPSNTEGCETAIEVRWQLQDTAGLSPDTFVPPGGAPSEDDVYVGTHGHWVFLIGKKSLVGHTADLPV